MDTSDLRTATDLDLAALDLDFESFRALASNPHLDANGRIGFPAAYREGFEGAILADILQKLPMIKQGEGHTIVDVGPGCSSLPRLLIDICRDRRHQVVLVDSDEMLSQLPDVDGVTIKCAGAFPGNARTVREAAGAPVSAILCYSVLQYIFVDSNLFTMLDECLGMLGDGGRVLFGDIPNASKRRRFFASPTGQAFHCAFTGTSQPPAVTFNEPSPGRIDDAVISGLIQRAQLAGCDAYLLPQGRALPMANRRDDLLVIRP